MLISLFVSVLLFSGDPAPPAPTSADDEVKAREFSFEIARLLNERDGEALAAAFDIEALLDRIFDYEGAKKATRLGFSVPFRMKSSRMGTQLCNTVMSEGAWAEPIRLTKNTDGSFNALVRVVRRRDTTFEYIDFRIASKESRWAISDTLSSLLPQSNSEYQRDQLYAGRSRAGSEVDQTKAKANRELIQLQSQSEYEAVLARLEEVEKTYEHTVFWQAQRIMALGKLGRFEEMSAAVTKALELDSSRIAAVMYAYNLSLSAKRFEEAISFLDLIDRWAGEDPYLEFVRGKLYLFLGKVELAIENFERSCEEDPYLPAPYRELLNVGVPRKRWSLVAKTLDGAEKYLGSDFTALPEAAAWQGFFASEEGKDWLAAWKLRQAEKAREQSEAEEASEASDDE